MTKEERQQLKDSTFVADVIKETETPFVRVTGVINKELFEKMQAAGLDGDEDVIQFFGEAVCDAVGKVAKVS